MKKVVITGGAGFIASHLAEACCRLESAPQVVILDNLRTGRQSNLERNGHFPNLVYQAGDIRDENLVDSVCEGADCIFHLAAMVSVPESLLKPLECVDINVNGTLRLLEAARRHKVGKVVLSSSAAIYGDDPELPKRETMRPAPKTPYGITKLDGEYYLEMYRQEYGISTVSLRYFNVYGPHQDPKSQYAAAVPIFLQKCLRGEPLTIFGDGQQTRDFIFVRDVAAANLWVAQHPEIHGVYNVATGRHITILELAETLKQLTGSSSQIVHMPERPGDIKDSWSDPAKLQATGFRCRYDLAQGLQTTVAEWSQV